ncbi:hypothetical protein PENSTE_c019G06520, partial [Penicillium steckii]
MHNLHDEDAKVETAQVDPLEINAGETDASRQGPQ